MMSRFLVRVRTALPRLAWLPVFLSLSTPVWAQQIPQEGVQANWVLSYALVILCLGLGVFVVCRPGRRSQDIRRPV